ncbi:hypothetical protein [Polynucleobacter necessarius]|uniref:hypothetical protein n=1 Tax=Polynucleobacter necessarius TaxID=576610 RepID=UPI0013B06087|nr:hypothetical protein [Polynucleobacter necessarius]
MTTIEQNLSPEVLEKVKTSLLVTDKVNIVPARSASSSESIDEEINVDSFFGTTTEE